MGYGLPSCSILVLWHSLQGYQKSSNYERPESHPLTFWYHCLILKGHAKVKFQVHGHTSMWPLYMKLLTGGIHWWDLYIDFSAFISIELRVLLEVDFWCMTLKVLYDWNSLLITLLGLGFCTSQVLVFVHFFHYLH